MGYHEDYLNKQLEERAQDERLFEETKKQLATEERFVNFFKNYNPASVAQFIDHYAKMKVMWRRHAGNFEHYAAMQLQRDRRAVVQHLEVIMLKKLFNLKCRWVAGELDVEGIAISFDFENWRTMPALQAAVGPITAEEFYCYLDYFNEGCPEPEDEDGMPIGSAYSAFMNYHMYRSMSAPMALEQIPEWFYRYDRSFDTAALMHLPTTRTDLEMDHSDIYMLKVLYPSYGDKAPNPASYADRLTHKRMAEDPEFEKEWRAESNRIYWESQANQPQYEHFSLYNRERMDEVVAAIETRDMQQQFRTTRDWTDLSNRGEDLFTPTRYLSSVNEHVPVPAHEDYEVALREAYENHRGQTMAKALVLVFDEYETCQRTGQLFAWNNESGGGTAAETRKRILGARAYMQLPENFDFLLKKNLP